MSKVVVLEIVLPNIDADVVQEDLDRQEDRDADTIEILAGLGIIDNEVQIVVTERCEHSEEHFHLGSLSGNIIRIRLDDEEFAKMLFADAHNKPPQE